MTTLRLFQPALIPGLLQTPEYIRAVLRRHDLSEDGLSPTINGRLEAVQRGRDQSSRKVQ
ncbi:Scr1 family TA system antitoxin-like transcriptional regulator [Streptomyces sp. NBC_01808]|uniref:Scr1 family TA system antitoxin-like transcriptional regulator n=1 Tax=Streptomyces sp. NBC_01808 TaxID=2975947 RepID=UPI003FA3774C